MYPYGNRYEDNEFDDVDMRPLVGLDGPAVTIAVNRPEVDTLRALSKSVPTGGPLGMLERVLRELDVRIGAAQSLMPERDRDTITVPLSQREHLAILDAYREADRRGRAAVPAWSELIRELDRRVGAAQAAAAQRLAANAVETFDRPDGTPPVPVAELTREYRPRRVWVIAPLVLLAVLLVALPDAPSLWRSVLIIVCFLAGVLAGAIMTRRAGWWPRG